jgi:hypothetical protein
VSPSRPEELHRVAYQDKLGTVPFRAQPACHHDHVPLSPILDGLRLLPKDLRMNQGLSQLPSTRLVPVEFLAREREIRRLMADVPDDRVVGELSADADTIDVTQAPGFLRSAH